MANVQKYFKKFNSSIRKSYDDNSILREKGDLLSEDLRDGLPRYARNQKVSIPNFEHFNQGSYAIGTGIEPLSGEDYDIDVGLIFHLSKDDYSPVQVKQWIYEVLHTGNRTVEDKGSCVRVRYHGAGEVLYHVDLAIYSESPSNGDNKLYLAKGFLGSKPENQIWEVAETKRLVETVQQNFSIKGTEINSDESFGT